VCSGFAVLQSAEGDRWRCSRLVVSVVGGQDLRLDWGRELLDVEQLVVQARVEGLDPGVLPGRAGIDVCGFGEPRLTPFGEDPDGELGPVVGGRFAGAPPRSATRLFRVATV